MKLAKYTVTRSCGHTEIIQLLGKVKDREWRLENVEPDRLCYECYQAELTAQREEENRKAAEAARTEELPELVGTPKQVAWAETCRMQLLEKIQRFIEKEIKPERQTDDLFAIGLQHVLRQTSASWWIDHREIGCYELPAFIQKHYDSAVSELEKPAVQAQAKAVEAEITIRPEKPRTETVAEIRVLESTVEIRFPERREDFRELARVHLKMKWVDGCWKKQIVKRNGSATDRAAEAGHRILAAGLPVRIGDMSIREKAIAGDYEPECTRWVQVRTTGTYQGWLAIRWDRPDDFYAAAKRMPGSRWDKPAVVVPVEQFEAALDFAKMYGFQVSAAAQQAIDAARETKLQSLVVRVESSPKTAMIASVKPPRLEVPQEVGVADEFRD